MGGDVPTQPAEEHYDFFLSYRGEDYPLAKQVYAILTGKGQHRVFFQPANIQLGQAFPWEITRAMQNSDRVLALVTPAYFHGSFWTEVAEFWNAAQAGKLVILRFKDAKIPLQLSQITFLPCTADTDDPEFEKTVISAGKLQQMPASQIQNRINFAKGMPGWKGTEGSTLVGRERELQQMHDALRNERCAVMCLIAGGGYGKSSLVSRFLSQVLDSASPLCRTEIQTAFAYSFYRQGSDPKTDAVSSKDFFESAIASIMGTEKVSGTKKLELLRDDLFDYLQDRPFLLVLDGLEPMQVPEGSDNAGALHNNEAEFQGFLKALAQLKGPMLTIITTRVMPTVFKGPEMQEKVEILRLGALDDAASRRVLCDGGLTPDDPRTAKLARDAGGHPLLLALLGPAVTSNYDVESFAAHRVLRDNGSNNEPETVSRFVNSYMVKLSKDPAKAAQAAAVLRAVCLFDRPMSFTELHNHLFSRKKIEDLTAPLWVDEGKRSRFAESHFKQGCELLRIANLLTVSSVDGRKEYSPRNVHDWKLEVHPLVQAGVQGGMIAHKPEVWRAAHKTIWLAINWSVRPLLPSTKDKLKELYRAAPHGVQAGQGFWAGWLYAIRCLRLFRAYGTNHHGMIREDLVFMSHMFTGYWKDIRDDIRLGDSGQVQACVWAGVLLIGVNRGEIGRDLMKTGLRLAEKTGQFVTASRTARNLAFAYAMVGDMDEALSLATQAVNLLDRRPRLRQYVTERLIVKRAMLRVAALANKGAILHYRGELDDARAAFAQAEKIQRSRRRKAVLRSIWGFHLAQLLIDTHQFDEADVRIDAALVNAGKFRKWGEGIFAKPILQLAYAKSRVRRADVAGERRDWANVQAYSQEIREQFGREDAQLQMDWLMPTFLTTLAGVARLSGDLGRGEAHLEEAKKYTDRGSAVLFEPDVGIEHARLLQAAGRPEQAKARLAKLRADCNLLATRAAEIDILEQAIN